VSNPGPELDLGIPGIVDAVLIGHSPSAATYQVRDAGSGNSAIVKILNAPNLRPERLDRFRAEQRVVQDLASHPGILTVYGTGVTSHGLPYVVSEPVRGGSIADRLSGANRLQGPDILALGVRMAGALESAHRGGVTHGDLRPEDLMLTEEGDPLIADFGVVALTGTGVGNTDDPRRLTHAAPELLDGESPTPSTDVYALASALFQLFAGKPAFVRPEDVSVIPVIKRIASSPLPDLAEMGVPAPVAAVITKAMAKDPPDRYESAEDFGRALQQAQLVGGFPMTEMPMLTPPSRVPASWLDQPKVPKIEGAAALGGPPAAGGKPSGGPGGPGGPPGGKPAGGPPGPGGPPSPATAKKKGRLPLIAATSVLVVALIGGGVFLATKGGNGKGGNSSSDGGGGGTPEGLGTSQVDVKAGDTFAVQDVKNLPKDSVLLIKIDPKKNDFDPKLTVTTGDGKLQDQYKKFFPDTSRVFPVGNDTVLSDVSDRSGVDGDALLVPFDKGKAGDSDNEVFPVPFGGDFHIVVFSADGKSSGAATLDIKSQTFANAPAKGQDYLDKLAAQKFVNRFAGKINFDLNGDNANTNGANTNNSDNTDVTDPAPAGFKTVDEKFAQSGAEMSVVVPDTWTAITDESNNDPILVASLGDPNAFPDAKFADEGVRVDGFGPGSGFTGLAADPTNPGAFQTGVAKLRKLDTLCTPGAVTDYATAAGFKDDGVFTGVGQRFAKCGGTGGDVVLLTIVPSPTADFMVTVEVHLGAKDNEQALINVASSFNLFNFPPAASGAPAAS
jgi:tRNA A-37 threonylcarbamoyl transferase component Bud32